MTDSKAPLQLAIEEARPPKAYVVGSGDRRPDILTSFDELRPTIESFVEIVDVDFEYAVDLSKQEFDLAIVIGGDGSILRAARCMGHHQRPVLGVNLGKLGFLADIPPSELAKALKSLVGGGYRLVKHLMIRCEVLEDGQQVADEIGLNELSILNGPPYSIQQIDLYIDGDLATTYSCDGIIVSTPVGSTAHNLSAGGPILRKNLQAFVISPISPHTLTVRPIVDTADRVVELVVRQPGEMTNAVLDGQPLCTLTSNHRVRISRAIPSFQLVEVHGHSYYGTLREKLGWSGGIDQPSRNG